MGLFSGIGKAISKVAGSVTGGDLLSFGSGLLGASGAASANESSMNMSQAQMDFQERMSNTAHQREVKDLIAAGLNPMLSAMKGSGAVTPSGSQAQHVENVARAGTDSAMSQAQRSLLSAQTATAETQAQLNSAQAAKAAVEARATAASAGLSEYELEAKNHFKSFDWIARAHEIDARAATSFYDIARANNDSSTLKSLNSLAHKNGYNTFNEAVNHTSFRNQLLDYMQQSLKTNELSAYSGMYASDYGKNVAPYVNSATSISGQGINLLGTGARAVRNLRK